MYTCISNNLTIVQICLHLDITPVLIRKKNILFNLRKQIGTENSPQQ